MIKKIDQQKMQEHLRELSKLAMKANIKHHTVIDKHATHARDLMKMLKEERAEISKLEAVIDMKQREIDELNKKEMDLYWEMGKLETNNGVLQEYKDNNEREVGYREKKMMSYMKKGKDN